MLYKMNIKLSQSLKAINDSVLYYEFIPQKVNKELIAKIVEKYSIDQKSYEMIERKWSDEKQSKISINLKEHSSLVLKKYNEKVNNDYFRNEAAAIIQKHESDSYQKINLYVNLTEYIISIFGKEEYLYQSLFEGVELGNYSFDVYKEKKTKEKLEVVFVVDDIKKAKIAFEKSSKIMDAVNFTKDLVNEPAITLTPKEFANRSRKKLSKLGINVAVWNKQQLLKNKMGAILAVGSASTNEPCMIVAHYKPKKKAKKKIALVGKGVTYDSGGLSIKPTAGMLQMNADMAGGAAAIGSITAAALLKAEVEIYCIVPAVENMLAGNSYKPGDVLKSASGKTIEVKDTDAEGRLILADALHYASKLKPDLIIDFATLTGAVAVALGLFSAGLMSKNDELVKAITESSERTYEKVWRLPFGDEYKKLLESDIADVSNLGPRWGGSITAGKFLEHFVDEKIPYAHLDIAGTALGNDLTNYTKKYHTGWGVRLMADYLENI